jgi:hypothetical protein
MAPLLHYALPAMGVCCNFPRSKVFAPTSHLGLGLQHLYTLQEIIRLNDIVTHVSKDTITRKL